MKAHPLAGVFPPMVGPEMEDLVFDIRYHGLQEPVTVYQGMIVDGLNREAACKEAGVPIRTEDWDEQGSLLDFIVSKNLHRRQLNPSQKALVAVELLPKLRREAKERQRQAGVEYGKGHPRASDIDTGSSDDEPGEAAQKAADLVHVSRTLVQRAERIIEEAPESVESIKANETSIGSVLKTLPYRLPSTLEHILTASAGHGNRSRAYLLTDPEREGLRAACIQDRNWTASKLTIAVGELVEGRDPPRKLHPNVVAAKQHSAEAKAKRAEKAAEDNTKQVKRFLDDLAKHAVRFHRFAEINTQPKVLAKFAPEGAAFAARKVDELTEQTTLLSNTLRGIHHD